MLGFALSITLGMLYFLMDQYIYIYDPELNGIFSNEEIIIEEMVEYGGLAQNIKKIAWEIQAKCSIKSFSLQDRFIHFFGDHQQLLSEHGLDVDKIFRSCLK